jgi:O-antigen/teichoic acid export membrane protein
MRLIERIVNAITELKAQSKAFGKALSLSVLNQVVSSGTNFVLALYLVRVLTTSDFGLYGIGFAITLLYAGVGDALFLTQMVVHVPDKAPQDRLPYAARILVALIMFCALTAIVAGVIILMGGAWSQLINKHVSLIYSIVIASIAYIIKDFFVRHSYTARKESWALWVNVAVAVTLASLLWIHFQFEIAFDSERALWIYAASNMVGALVGFALVRLPILTVRLREVFHDVREAWVGGRWALGGVAVTWTQTQAYMYISALFLGPAGVAYANAARLFITPAIFLVPAIGQIVAPRLAALRASNPQRMMQIGILFTTGLIAFSMLYSITLLGMIDVIKPILIGAKYADITPLVAAWCLVLVFQFSRSGTGIVLLVMKEFRLITLVNLASLVVAIVAALILMKAIQVQGAILGTALGELMLSVLLYREVMRLKSHSK